MKYLIPTILTLMAGTSFCAEGSEVRDFCAAGIKDSIIAVIPADSLFSDAVGGLSPQVLEQQAETAFKECRWADAERSYRQLIEDQMAADGLNISGLKTSSYRAWYGKMLHSCALSCMFQGNEDEGIRLLGISASCGDRGARRQHEVLTGNSFYQNKLKIRRRDTDSFEEYLSEFDFRFSSENPDAE